MELDILQGMEEPLFVDSHFMDYHSAISFKWHLDSWVTHLSGIWALE